MSITMHSSRWSRAYFCEAMFRQDAPHLTSTSETHRYPPRRTGVPLTRAISLHDARRQRKGTPSAAGAPKVNPHGPARWGYAGERYPSTPLPPMAPCGGRLLVGGTGTDLKKGAAGGGKEGRVRRAAEGWEGSKGDFIPPLPPHKVPGRLGMTFN